MSFDISDTLAPKSDQLDAIDLRISGPRVFTIERVSKGNAEQPIQVHLVEFDRPWRPGVTMRRVLAHCWGSDAGQWAGRKVRLFCDDSVTFGKERPGGSRISHLSHIERTQTVPLLVSQGRSGTYTVEPLTESADTTATDEIAALRAEWSNASDERKAQIESRVAELQATA